VGADWRLSLVLAVSLVAPVRSGQGADGPRIVAADQSGRRVLLIDRASKAVIAENHQLTRVDCVARSRNEFLVCDGPMLVRMDRELNVLSRFGTRAQVVSRVAVAGNTLLVSSNASRSVTEIDPSDPGALPIWSVEVHWPQDAVRLGNGHTLVADGTPVLKEFDRGGDVVRSLMLRRWAASVERLPGGETLVGESTGYELFDGRGSRVWFREWPGRVTCVQALEAGEILLCDPDARHVAIVDRDGDVVWESGIGLVWSAVYVP